MTELHTELHDDEEQLSTADMAHAGKAAVPADGKTQERVLPNMSPAGPNPARMAARAPAATPKPAPGAPDTAPAVPNAARPEHAAPLFAAAESQELRSNWDAIQTGFVDNPRQAVEQADHLVAQAIKRLAEMFANERNQLEQQWSRGDNVSTEDLRVALQRYRSFFDRLLSF